MNRCGLLVRLEAKPGKEAEVEKFLASALTIVEKEPATRVWHALRFGPSSFGVFDVFPDQPGREKHLSGEVAAALKAMGSELFASPPIIEVVEIIAEKISPTEGKIAA